MPHDNIINRLLENTKKNPRKIAIVDFKKKFTGITYQPYTYLQVLSDVLTTADRLRKIGFRKYDRIIVFVPMSYNLYILILAIWYIGAVTVFIDAWADKTRLANACKVVEPRGFIGILKAHLLRVNPEIRKIPMKFTDRQVLVTGAGTVADFNSFTPELTDPDDIGLITLTTGSTGLPKGVKRTQGFLREQYIVLNNHFQLTEQDVDLTALPVFVLMNLAINITSVLPVMNPATPAAFNEKIIVSQIQKFGITTSIGSPIFYDRLSAYLLAHNIPLSIGKIFTGGAPLFKPVARSIKKAFPDTRIEIVYGCTEAEPVSGILIDDFLNSDSGKGISVGKKVPEIDARVVAATDDIITVDDAHPFSGFILPPDQVGEIIVSGPHVLKEYLGSPDLSSQNKIMVNGIVWHRTGDAGLIDREGNIYLHGRVKNSFTVNGRTCYPIPFEQKLRDIPGVAFAALTSVKGSLIAVLEITDSGANHSVIIAQAKEMLKEISPRVIVSRIPRDPRHQSKVNFEELGRLVGKTK